MRILTGFSCFLIGICMILCIMILPACQTIIMPPIDAKFWAGDSQKKGISRSQNSEAIECENPQFDDYVCLTYEDLKKIYDTMLKCKQWSEIADRKQIKQFLKSNQEVVHYALQKPTKPF